MKPKMSKSYVLRFRIYGRYGLQFKKRYSVIKDKTFYSLRIFKYEP